LWLLSDAKWPYVKISACPGYLSPVKNVCHVPALKDGLTPREAEVLGLIAAGLSKSPA